MGLLLIAAAIFLTDYNLYDQQRAGKSAREVSDCLKERIPDIEETPFPKEEEPERQEVPDYVLNPGMEMPVETVNGKDYIGILSIPKLELELPVISHWNYPSLKIAPCRYHGSAYTGDLIIAGHNYASHFGRLKTLSEGDAVTFTDVDGNVFHYQVSELEILQPFAIEEMESGDWELTLFTCTLGGRTRVTVRCREVEQ